MNDVSVRGPVFIGALSRVRGARVSLPHPPRSRNLIDPPDRLMARLLAENARGACANVIGRYSVGSGYVT